MTVCSYVFGSSCILLVAAAIASSAVDAHAQSLIECHSIEDTARRLACYDDIKTVKSELKQEAGEVIALFSGNKTGSTQSFTVVGPWKMRWSVDGGWMSVALIGATGRMVDYYGAGNHATTGNASFAKGGTFSLEAITNQRWQIEITSVP